jgi:hypothetical protein
MYVGVLISLWFFPVSPTGGLQHNNFFFLNVLKKLEQRSHKCVELRGEYVE